MTNLDVRNNIDYINYPKRIFPIGRLDKASEGLIFMTNDGDIVNKIRARNNHEKRIYGNSKQAQLVSLKEWEYHFRYCD
jgi:16S rRNA U516 pseudouridylate synthase RsuA-like enzyme